MRGSTAATPTLATPWPSTRVPTFWRQILYASLDSQARLSATCAHKTLGRGAHLGLSMSVKAVMGLLAYSLSAPLSGSDKNPTPSPSLSPLAWAVPLRCCASPLLAAASCLSELTGEPGECSLGPRLTCSALRVPFTSCHAAHVSKSRGRGRQRVLRQQRQAAQQCRCWPKKKLQERISTHAVAFAGVTAAATAANAHIAQSFITLLAGTLGQRTAPSFSCDAPRLPPRWWAPMQMLLIPSPHDLPPRPHPHRPACS